MNTLFLLMAEYETSDIPLEKVAVKYFGHEFRKMNEWARHRKYPFPIFRGGSQKSQWLVSAEDLARYLDKVKEEARNEFTELTGAA